VLQGLPQGQTWPTSRCYCCPKHATGLAAEATTTTGNFFIDDEVLAKAGVTDLGRYSVVPGSKQLMPDLFL
jgi:hypothetical protein